ncbi:MAG: response regulator transcription factor [Crocinitomicaceae bacterium]|nr:response regulator transcription factor [Crocinitomicaceae bacterium]
MEHKITIALAEDHTILRETLEHMFNDDDSFSFIFSAGNGQELLDQLHKTPVDVVLLDLEMPILDGREALKKIRSLYPNTKVIVLSMHYTDLHIKRYMAAGANGYLSKDTDFEILIDAIKNVHYSGIHFDEKVSMKLIHEIMNKKLTLPKFIKNEPLTNREIEILLLICEQKTSSEIAKLLSISARTVENHRENMLKKTGARNSIGLFAYAVSFGIYEFKI